MKRLFLLSSVILFTVATQAQGKAGKPVAKGAKPAPTSGLKTANDSLSYAFGISLGNYMKSQSVNVINYKMMNQAIESTLKGSPALMDGAQANQIMGKLAEAKTKQAAAGEKEKSRKFLEENKKRAGVITTASGLQYEVLVEGKGEKLNATDTFKANYIGSLINGKEFDNSYKRGKPLTLPVTSVIRGWTEALTLMPIGSKWKVFIPSEIGYGDNGAGQDIPGGATLIFEMELLGKGTLEDMNNQ